MWNPKAKRAVCACCFTQKPDKDSRERQGKEDPKEAFDV
jgi:hypothetical protein